MSDKKVYILNTLMVPVDFSNQEAYTIEQKKLSLDEAKTIVSSSEIDSAVGIQSMAQLLSQLLGTEIPVNRKQLSVKIGDEILGVSVGVRLPEGKILGAEELQQLQDKLKFVDSVVKEGKPFFDELLSSVNEVKVLNTLMVPADFDKYSHVVVEQQKISLDDAVELLKRAKIDSAIGHQGTAQLMTELTGVTIPAQRKELKLGEGDVVLHMMLDVRLNEGQVLKAEELENLYNQGKIKFIVSHVAHVD